MPEIARDNPNNHGTALGDEEWIRIIKKQWHSAAMKIHHNQLMDEYIRDFNWHLPEPPPEPGEQLLAPYGGRQDPHPSQCPAVSRGTTPTWQNNASSTGPIKSQP